MQTAAFLALGVLVGFVAGLFGVGGGFLLTPLLAIVGVPIEIAVGTGLCQIVATSLASILRHREQRTLGLRFDVSMIGGAVVGVDLGARLLDVFLRWGDAHVLGRKLPWVRLVLQPSYVLLLVVVGAMFLGKKGEGTAAYVRSGPLARIPIGPRIAVEGLPGVRVPVIVVAYVGLAMGALSGLLGIGGGVLLIPVLVYGFGYPLRAAAGTGIVILFVTSVVGTVRHALAGHVDLGLAMTLLAGAPLAAQVGVRVGQTVAPRVLRGLFVAVAGATIGAVVWDVWRRLG